VTFEDEGFLGNRWDDLAAPDALDTCAHLADGIKREGGLFGGSVDE